MRDSGTEPDIQDAIYQAIKQFPSTGDNVITNRTWGRPLRLCVAAQNRIGWLGFLEGILTPNWARLQEAHFRQSDSRRSGLRWATSLSKQLWTLVFSMWDHRNTILFSKSKVDELSGISKIKLAIVQERSIGLGPLDQYFAPYLALSQSSFDKMKSIDLRRWLSLIRSTREELGYQYDDEIATSSALRS